MMLRAVGRRASTGSVTVLGDLAQATTPWATRSWSESLAHLGHPEALVEELVAGFRVPGAVIDFAARLLPQHRPDADAAALGPPAPRRAGPAATADPDAAVVAARPSPRWSRGHDRGDRRRRRGEPGPQALSRPEHPLRAARRGRPDLRHPGGPGARHAGQGPGVRPRGAARAGRHRRRRARRGDRAAPALRLPDPRGHLPGRRARPGPGSAAAREPRSASDWPHARAVAPGPRGARSSRGATAADLPSSTYPRRRPSGRGRRLVIVAGGIDSDARAGSGSATSPTAVGQSAVEDRDRRLHREVRSAHSAMVSTLTQDDLPSCSNGSMAPRRTISGRRAGPDRIGHRDQVLTSPSPARRDSDGAPRTARAGTKSRRGRSSEHAPSDCADAGCRRRRVADMP